MSAGAVPAVERKPAGEPKLAESAGREEGTRWRPVLGLPCHLTIDLSLSNFRVRDFLSLRAGSIVGTEWAIARDLPVRVNGTVIASGELEGAGNRLAVRLTELA